jgi:dihydrofolate reductase
MLGGRRVTFVMLLDKKNHSFSGLTRRIADHQDRVAHLIATGTCLVGRKSQELTGWKGPGLWVLTRNRKWTRNEAGVVHSLDDARLHLPAGGIHVLGGVSVYGQLEKYVDEYMLWTVHSREGDEECTAMLPSHWKASAYKSENNWSYAQLTRAKREKKVKT